MAPAPTSRTDDQLVADTDIAALLRYGLTRPGFRTALFGDGAVAAAVTLDRLGVVPRSVAYLGKVVRAGGVRYAAELAEPLPSPEASAVLRGWLEEAAPTAGTQEAETAAARWLTTVAELMGARRAARGG
ncbi:hypothetical protein [Streptomyces sp. VRA16 Mangrove soil]|uniref:hypothetical protein n=1 Tax=Streptomyces sp. VRA16 Mangrove soil TaxID=2817434 RepID=UPI001A9D7F2E|nr:hypothetical protein [Streptomyces sp. VRA16 Mangrove soil]MBO1334660.1 hypothetical protein [Streptomyces sp. VRA16 Mangrove soil]